MPNSFCLLVKPRSIFCHCVLPLYFHVMSILFSKATEQSNVFSPSGSMCSQRISSHDLEQDELYSIWVLKVYSFCCRSFHLKNKLCLHEMAQVCCSFPFFSGSWYCHIRDLKQRRGRRRQRLGIVKEQYFEITNGPLEKSWKAGKVKNIY